MPPLHWESRPATLRAPALICAFGGWSDAADAASASVIRIIEQLGARRFAHIDDERFFDFQSTRPYLRALDACKRELDWPEIVFYAAHLPKQRRDLILLTGPEPAMRWRTFAAAVVELAEALDVQLAVTLGAVLGDVPHTRPVVLTGLTTDAEMAERVGLSLTAYEGSTGITGVLHTTFEAAGIPAASIWAAIPHYIAATSNPAASLSLLRKTSRVVRLPFDLMAVSAEATEFRNRIDTMIDSDPELRMMVDRLEHHADYPDDPLPAADAIPDGETLAAEFQRYLRRRDEYGGGRVGDDG